MNFLVNSHLFCFHKRENEANAKRMQVLLAIISGQPYFWCMLRLKNRNRAVPGGLPWFGAQSRFQAPRYASFDTIVRGEIQARLANPAITKQHNLATDYESVANEVDYAGALFCYQRKYFDYIEGEPERGQAAAARPFQQVPQTRPTPGQNARKLAVGAESIVDWIAGGAEAVPSELANKRAATCVACPLNERVASLTDVFTNAVAAGIRSALNWRKEWKLETPDDERLGLCTACGCVNKLAIHMPLDKKIARMPAEVKALLWSDCWVNSEQSVNQ
jgi:hypothetical protein